MIRRGFIIDLLNTLSMRILIQPIIAKKNYDICKFQLFKKITISHKILNASGLYLDCIRPFQERPHKAKFSE